MKVVSGTKEHVHFREADETYRYTDIDLEAMVGCISIVTDYDKEKYNSDSDVELAIKDNCTKLMQKCLDSLPENRSVMKSDKQQIAEKFDQELSLMGITASTQVRQFALTGDSREIYDRAMKMEDLCGALNTSDVGDPLDGPMRAAGKYKVNYPKGMMGFTSDFIYYSPGDNVVVSFDNVMTDTAYEFFCTAENYEVKRDDCGRAKIMFVMPEHDVQVSVSVEQQRFGPISYEKKDNGFMGFAGFAKMMEDQRSAPVETGAPKDWCCPNCNAVNKGRFCSECGTPKPSGWTCECGSTNAGKFCANCGKPKP